MGYLEYAKPARIPGGIIVKGHRYPWGEPVGSACVQAIQTLITRDVGIAQGKFWPLPSWADTVAVRANIIAKAQTRYFIARSSLRIVRCCVIDCTTTITSIVPRWGGLGAFERGENLQDRPAHIPSCKSGGTRSFGLPIVFRERSRILASGCLRQLTNLCESN